MGLLRVILLGLVLFLYVTSAKHNVEEGNEEYEKGEHKIEVKKGGHAKGDDDSDEKGFLEGRHGKGGDEEDGDEKDGDDKDGDDKDGDDNKAKKGGHRKRDEEDEAENETSKRVYKKGGEKKGNKKGKKGGHGKGDEEEDQLEKGTSKGGYKKGGEKKGHKKGKKGGEGKGDDKGGVKKGTPEGGSNKGGAGKGTPEKGSGKGGAGKEIPEGGIAKGGTTFDVTQFGAQGDGSTLDSPAFLKAWEQACKSSAKLPVVMIPKGNYILSATEFLGPCNAPAISVQLSGNIISSPQQSHWKKCTDFISFRNVNNLQISGSGTIDGNGAKWWGNELSCGHRPTSLALNGCKGVSVSGIQSKNSARNHMSISGSSGVSITGITLTAPDTSPNTDGIDISSSSSITIKNSVIGSGDDCIAINKDSKDINVNGVKCGPGHGISIGSLGKGGEFATVENVIVSSCTFIKTDNGARIKTWKGGRGYVRNVVYRDITLIDVRRPIIIDQNYVDKNNPNANEDSAFTISDVRFINFKGTCRDSDAITLECNSGTGCTGVELANVNIQGSGGAKPQSKCENANVKTMSIQPQVSCLQHAGKLDYSKYLAMTEIY